VSVARTDGADESLAECHKEVRAIWTLVAKPFRALVLEFNSQLEVSSA